MLGQVGDQAALRREGLKWKDFIDQGYVIAGSPKTVRERLREAMKSLNCGHLMMLQQIGSMPPELVRKSTSLFATEVMPHMRDLWSNFEDRWSPKRDLPQADFADAGAGPLRARAEDQRHGARIRVGVGGSAELEMNTTQKLLNGKFSLEMQTYGSSGEPLLFMHGAGGLMPVEPFLEELGKHFKVYAPQFPGYGESTGNEYIDDIADAVLFYHELMDELGNPDRQHRRPFDGRDARGGSRGVRHSSREKAGADSAGRFLDRRSIRFPICSPRKLDRDRAAAVPRSQLARGAADDRDTVGLQSARNDVRRAGQALRDRQQIPVADSRPRAEEARLSHSRRRRCCCGATTTS